MKEVGKWTKLKFHLPPNHSLAKSTNSPTTAPFVTPFYFHPIVIFGGKGLQLQIFVNRLLFIG
ncbi:unnamed protein product [Rhodiola kirilowii]